MALPTQSDLHVDVPLTNVSIAYVQNAQNFIAAQAAPSVPVQKQSDKYYSFDKQYFRRSQMQKRAPGAPAKRADYAVAANGPYFADVWSLAKDITDEQRKNADPGVDPERGATKFLTMQALIAREKDFASKFLATGKWGTDYTPGTLWSASNSTPLEDVATAKSTVLTATGIEPMHMVITYPVWLALKNHAEIVDRVKYGQTGPGPAKVTLQAIAALMELEAIYVAKASEDTSNEGAAAANAFIGGKNALVYYRTDAPALEEPSAMYSFDWTGYTGAGPNGQRVLSYRRPEEYHSDSVEIEMAFDNKVIASDCGYFFSNVVS